MQASWNADIVPMKVSVMFLLEQIDAAKGPAAGKWRQLNHHGDLCRDASYLTIETLVAIPRNSQCPPLLSTTHVWSSFLLMISVAELCYMPALSCGFLLSFLCGLLPSSCQHIFGKSRVDKLFHNKSEAPSGPEWDFHEPGFLRLYLAWVEGMFGC